MKALSIRQPWAWLILHAGKNIENRTWSTTFRGEFLIHAAKRMTFEEYDSALEFAYDLNPALEQIEIPHPAHIIRGGIVGTARLVDVIPPHIERPDDFPWNAEGQFGLILADVREVPFVQMNGRLGFFDVPAI